MNQVTPEEIQWAKALKEAAEDDPRLDASAISDTEFLQQALVSKADTAKALHRLGCLQKFKEQYGIHLDGSHEDGMRDMRIFQSTFPGFLLSMTELANHSTLLCCDHQHFLGAKATSPESHAIIMRGLFYLLQAGNHNIPAIRAGWTLLGDGKGMGWKNFSLPVEQKAAGLYGKAYPVRIQRIIIMNANPLVVFLYNIIKLFLTKKVREKHSFVGELNGYLEASPFPKTVLPKLWNGNVKENEFLQEFSRRLEERYDLVAKFRL